MNRKAKSPACSVRNDSGVCLVLRGERKLPGDKDTPECGNLSSYDLSGAEIKPRSLDPQPAYTNRMQEETGCSGQDDTRFLSVQRMGRNQWSCQ